MKIFEINFHPIPYEICFQINAKIPDFFFFIIYNAMSVTVKYRLIMMSAYNELFQNPPPSF